MLLSEVIAIWDILHQKNTGELGFNDLVAAAETATGTVVNDLGYRPTAPRL